MKISTEIHSGVVHVGEEKTVELLAKAGFTAFDFSMCDMFRYDWNNHCVIENGSPLRSSDYLAFARRVKQVGLDNGIVCNQSHAPYPMVAPGVYPYILRAIECTAEAGGDICVIHPDNNGTPEQNAEIYHKLLRFVITWIIPFGFVAYLPASYFLGAGSGNHIAVIGIECAIAAIFWFVAYGVFKKGLKSYESAGN